MVVGETLRLRQQSLLPLPFLWGFFSFFLCCPLSFSGFSGNASLLQCEKEVREGTFMFLLGGAHSSGPGLGVAIKDQGEDPKVGQCGDLRDRSPVTWAAPLSEPSPLAMSGTLGCGGYSFTLPLTPTVACLFFV